MPHDLMHQNEIRGLVRDAYLAIPTGGGRQSAQRFYGDDELASLPESAVSWSLGVGNPVPHAAISEGELVLDIGSGGGIDTILAARQVGPSGHVIGIDMLPEMCVRAATAADAAGVGDRCEFRDGIMEDLPVDDRTIDVVISNGVVNLSPRKSRVLAEIARVLRPGGRMCIADLTVDDDLPTEVLTSDAAWAGCISGALSEAVLRSKLTAAGLVDVVVSEHQPFSIDDVAVYPLFGAEIVDLMRARIPADRHGQVGIGVIVHAVRPG